MGRKSTAALFWMATILTLFATGCAGSKKTTTEVIATKNLEAEQVLEKLLTNQVSVEWMSAKAKVGVDDGYTSVRGSAYIRMRKDSVLWMAVRKLGFEVARVQITTDSLFVIDRLNNEFIADNLEQLSRQYSLPGNFQALQALLLGNPFFLTSLQRLRAENEAQRYHLYTRESDQESHYWLNGGSFKLQRMTYTDYRQQQKLELELDQYEEAPGSREFSYLRNLKVNSDKTGEVKIDIEFSDVEFNIPKSIRFEIPERYKRAD